MNTLSGKRILCLEDETLVAMLIEDILLDSGCDVIGPYAKMGPALEFLSAGQIDGAVLDINLNGEMSFPLADLLAARGLPYIFVTGYGEAGLNERHESAVVVQKPFRSADLVAALNRAISASIPPG